MEKGATVGRATACQRWQRQIDHVGMMVLGSKFGLTCQVDKQMTNAHDCNLVLDNYHKLASSPSSHTAGINRQGWRRTRASSETHQANQPHLFKLLLRVTFSEESTICHLPNTWTHRYPRLGYIIRPTKRSRPIFALLHFQPRLTVGLSRFQLTITGQTLFSYSSRDPHWSLF